MASTFYWQLLVPYGRTDEGRGGCDPSGGPKFDKIAYGKVVKSHPTVRNVRIASFPSPPRDNGGLPTGNSALTYCYCDGFSVLTASSLIAPN